MEMSASKVQNLANGFLGSEEIWQPWFITDLGGRVVGVDGGRGHAPPGPVDRLVQLLEVLQHAPLVVPDGQRSNMCVSWPGR